MIGGGQELLVRGIGKVKSIADLQQSVVKVRAGRTPGDADGAGVSMAHVDVELSDRDRGVDVLLR